MLGIYRFESGGLSSHYLSGKVKSDPKVDTGAKATTKKISEVK